MERQAKEGQVDDVKLTRVSAVLESVQSLQKEWQFCRPGDRNGVFKVRPTFDGRWLARWSSDARRGGLWGPALLLL